VFEVASGRNTGGGLSSPVEVDLSRLFDPSRVRLRYAEEVSLTANQASTCRYCSDIPIYSVSVSTMSVEHKGP